MVAILLFQAWDPTTEIVDFYFGPEAPHFSRPNEAVDWCRRGVNGHPMGVVITREATK